MTNLLGGKLTTSGTRERTVINVTSGPKAIEELALDVVILILQPVFFKWEMTHCWESAKNQPECPVSEAFHANSFKVSFQVFQIFFLEIKKNPKIFRKFKFSKKIYNNICFYFSNNFVGWSLECSGLQGRIRRRGPVLLRRA